jgi:hypothetical protein
LIRDLRVRLEKNQWRFRLGPYSVQSFRVEGSSGVDSVAAASVRARPLADPGPQITAAAEEAEGALTWVKDHPDLPLADDQKAALRALTEGLARIADRRQKGDLAGAYEIATSWEFRRAPAVVTAITIPWALIGPFDNKDRAGFDQAYAPEADYLAGKPYQPRYQTLAGESAWKQKQAGLDGLIDLDPLFAPNENVVAYAATEVYSPTEQPVVFHVGTDDGFKLWVNGKLMGQYNGQRNVAPDQNRVPAQLVQGWNRILLKADNVLGAWAFILTITDPQGNVLGDLRFRLPAGTAK